MYKLEGYITTGVQGEAKSKKQAIEKLEELVGMILGLERYTDDLSLNCYDDYSEVEIEKI